MPTTQRVSTTRILGAAVAAIALLCAVTFAGGSAQAATTPTPVWKTKVTAPVLTLAPLSTAAQYQNAVLAATNAQRAANGRKPFTVTSCLSGFATKWAAHLAGTRTLTHQSLSPFLSDCHSMAVAENIADGNVTAADVVTLWMNSPDHRANLLNSAYTHIGIGAAKSGSTWYVVQDFSS
jgi:uncharacterized protein YkwD